jgi:hypothetical protein
VTVQEHKKYGNPALSVWVNMDDSSGSRLCRLTTRHHALCLVPDALTRNPKLVSARFAPTHGTEVTLCTRKEFPGLVWVDMRDEVSRLVMCLNVREPVFVGLENPMFSNNIGDGVTSHQCVLLGGGGRVGRSGWPASAGSIYASVTLSLLTLGKRHAPAHFRVLEEQLRLAEG